MTSYTFVTSNYFIIKAARDESVCWQQPLNVSDGCLTVWWPWDRSYFSVSRSLLWCICTDLAFWMIAGWTGSGSGGCCPWWYFWPSCDIGWCRCPGGQVVCPRWCVVQNSPPSGEPYGCGWSSCRTRRYSPTGCSRLCICKSLSVFGDKPNFFGSCAFFTTLSVWVNHLKLMRRVCVPVRLYTSCKVD